MKSKRNGWICSGIKLLLLLFFVLGATPLDAQELLFDVRQFDAGGAISDLAILDANEDGISDVVVVQAGARQLGLFRGRRRGSFDEFKIIAGLAAPPRFIDAGDLNEDGHDDLAILDDDKLQVFLGNGQEGFDLVFLSTAIGTIPKGVEIVDLNQDLVPDIAVCCHDDGNVFLFHGDGAGGFAPPDVYGAWRTCYGFAFGDVNSDRRNDISLALGSSGVATLTSTGSGIFDVSIATSVREGWMHTAVAIRNGLPVVASWTPRYGGEIALLRQNGRIEDFRFTLHGLTEIPLGDLDRDGSLDVLVPHRVYFVTESSGIPRIVGTEIVSSLSRNRTILQDLTGDGDLDVVLPAGRGLAFLVNRSNAHLAVRAGNVNLGAGPAQNVLFLNGSAGVGQERQVSYPVPERRFILSIAAPALARQTPVPYALYVWLKNPELNDVVQLPHGMGWIGLPPPLLGGNPQPIETWNNAGRVFRLGEPTRSSRGAPETIVDLSRGPRRIGSFYVQGMIYDPGALADIPASVTNGIWAVPVLD